MTMLHWIFKNLSTVKYETNRYEISENYENILISVNTANITLVPSEDGKTTVECYEEQNVKHLVKTENGTLEIKYSDTRKWYEHIGVIGFETTRITVYLPAGEYASLSVSASTGNTEIPKDFRFESMDISASTGSVMNAASAAGDIRIKTTTGDIRMENVSARNVSLSVSTGKITVTGLTCEKEFRTTVGTGDAKLVDIACENLFSEGSTGHLTLTNVIASQKLSVKRNTGDVTFDGCDADEIFAKTTTGKITGTLLTAKDFSACRSDTGSIRVPATDGTECELVTDTGNIKIEISK